MYLRALGRTLLMSGVLVVALPASAQVVGSAVAVTPAAQAENARGATILARGKDVNAFDKVRTSVDGTVTLRFRDGSNLDVGPGSLVTIDRFVYNPDDTAREAAITMTKGTFRWVSGRSAKEAYALKTPASTLGIRGTDFTLIADLTSTVVELRSGAVRACSLANGRCNTIDRPGQGVRIWNDGRIENFAPGSLLHGQIRRMAHHMRAPGLHRPTMPSRLATVSAAPQPAAQAGQGGQPATTGRQTAAGLARQQWTGSFLPRTGLASLPNVATMPSVGPGSGPFAQQNATLVRDNRAQMQKPIQGGMMPGGPRMGASPNLQRVQQPGIVERKGEAKMPILR